MNKLHNDNVTNFTLKFAEFKKEYASDIKLILNNNNQENQLYIKPLLSEYNQILQDKTKILLITQTHFYFIYFIRYIFIIEIKKSKFM